MKAASAQLKTFLASCTAYARLHLVTITLADNTVLRYTDGGQTINYGGQNYAPLVMAISGLKQTRGLSVDAITIEIKTLLNTVVGGVALGKLAANGGLRGANVKIERLIGQDFATLYTSGPVGGVILFSGRVSEFPEGHDTGFTLRVASWAEVLDGNLPHETYTATCRNTLFDNNCGVVKASYTAAGAVAAGTITKYQFPTNIVAAANFYQLGYMQFTSGQNAGLRRTLRAQGADGIFTLTSPYPYTPAQGDAFIVVAGCNCTMAQCQTKFNNLLKYRGEPFIPNPETAA